MPLQKVDKKTIIRNSLQVFRAKGYHGATMADIAKACGLLKGSIYHYFSSKEDLMMQVIETLSDHYRRDVFSVAYQDQVPAKERLERLGELSEQIFCEEEGGCLMANIGLECVLEYPQFTRSIREFFQEWVEAMAHLFSSKMDVQLATKEARRAVAEIEGSVMLMVIFSDRAFLQEAHQRILERFLNIIPSERTI